MEKIEKGLIVYRITTLLLLSNSCFCQTDTLNGYNTKHHKNGFWKIYLNDHLVLTKDTSESFFYAYEYYDNGTLVICSSSSQSYKRKLKKVVCDDKIVFEKGHPILINGDFKFYSENGLEMEELYKNGLPLIYTTYGTDTKGKLIKTEIIDYQNKYKGQFGSFYYESYFLNGMIQYKYHYGKGSNGKWGEQKE